MMFTRASPLAKDDPRIVTQAGDDSVAVMEPITPSLAVSVVGVVRETLILELNELAGVTDNRRGGAALALASGSSTGRTSAANRIGCAYGGAGLGLGMGAGLGVALVMP